MTKLNQSEERAVAAWAQCRTRRKDAIRVVAVHSVFQAWRYHYYSKLARRPELDLIVLHGAGVPGTKLRNASDNNTVVRIELKQWRWRTGLSGRQADLLWFPKLLRCLRLARADVVLLEGGSNFLNSIATVLWCKANGVPVIWWTLGELRNRSYSWFGRLMRRVVRWCERKADALLLYSSVGRQYALGIGIPSQRCFVATNVVDTRRAIELSELEQSASLRLRESLFGTRPVVIFLGALATGKRLELLPQIFAEVRESVQDAEFLIIGDGGLRADLSDMFEERGILVTFVGQQQGQELSRYLNIGNVLVLPGLGGLAISEAMAHGLPVVCHICDGTEQDLVRNGETGFLVAADDAHIASEFARKIAMILSDCELNDRMARNAKALVRDVFSGDKMVDAIVQCITHVAFARGAQHPNSRGRE